MKSPGADAIRRVTYQHVRIRSLLMMLPLVLLSGSMALASLDLVSEEAGAAIALASIAAVALAAFRFKRRFGVVVPARPPQSQHVVRDGLVGLAAVILDVSRPQTAVLYILVGAAILVAVILEYRDFARRLPHGR